MSLKVECHSKWNVTQNEIYSKWNVTQNGMALKMECRTKWNVTKNGMSLKMECVKKSEKLSSVTPHSCTQHYTLLFFTVYCTIN